MLKNPYGTAMTVRDPRQFAGRQEALDYLYSEIVAHSCVSVIGSRRIGKSSLLYCLAQPAIQQAFAELYDLNNYLLVFVDVGEFLSCSVEDFFAMICDQLVLQAGSRLSLSPHQEMSGADRFWHLLEQLQELDFYPVLLMDGFQKITRNPNFDPRFFAFMRSQANSGRVSYITSSLTTLDQCCHAYVEGSPFFNIFIPYRLGPLTEEEAHQLITQPAAAVGMPFTEEEVRRITILAGRHPFFIQRIAFLLFREKTQEHQNHAQQLTNEMYQDLLPHFKDIWEHSLETTEREILKEEALWKHVPQRRLPELSESALFLQFVRNTCNIQLVDITPEALEFVLENYRDTRVLAESELVHLYLFSLSTQHISRQLTLNDKAIYVRKMLQEARDHLAPLNKPHSDTDADWQFINILNYRYFREHMKNEVLAERIGISVRQLHRERKIAIQLLRNELIEMESKAKEEIDRL